MMPEMNGYRGARAPASGPGAASPAGHHDLGVDEVESVVRCIELGADDYLPKPFNPTLLRARVGAMPGEEAAARRNRRAMLARWSANSSSHARSSSPWCRHRPSAATDASAVALSAVLRPAREVGGDLYDFSG